MSYNYGYYADDLENDEVDEWDYDDEHYNAELAYDGVGDFDTAPYAKTQCHPPVSRPYGESPPIPHQLTSFSHPSPSLRNEGPSHCQERKSLAT